MPKSRVTYLAFLLTFPMLLLVSLPHAAGDTAQYEDPNDAEGPLDIKYVSHGHYGELLEHRIGTISRWELEDVRKKMGFGILINVTSNDPSPPPEDSEGGDPDHCINGYAAKRLRAEMVDCEQDLDGPVIGPVKVLHPKPKLLILRFPDHYLRYPGTYEYNVQMVWYGRGCSEACPDFAPGYAPLDLFGEHPR
jgi:hypothetical protein